MELDDVKVLVQVRCTRCEGSGRVGWDTPTAGGFAPDGTKPCAECAERGHVETAVAMPEFRRLLGLPRAAIAAAGQAAPLDKPEPSL